MPNKNYEQGRQAEWSARRDLEQLGFSCIRAASSHGVYDVCGVRGDSVVLIQCKRGQRPSPCDYQTLIDLAVPDGVIKIALWYPPAMAAARVLYRNVALPAWCGTVRWMDGPPPRQGKLRGI